MGFSRFGLLIALRLTGLLSAMALTGYLLLTGSYPMATLLCSLVSVGLAAETFRFVRKTNLEVARFLDAARYADSLRLIRFQKNTVGRRQQTTSGSKLTYLSGRTWMSLK